MIKVFIIIFIDQHYQNVLILEDHSNQIGMKQYGIDQLPIVYDIKFEQERPTIIEKK